MSKIRVYEYAKQKNKSSKEIINKLKELNLPVSNHMSTISEDMKSKLDEQFQKNEKTPSNTKSDNQNKNHTKKKNNKENKENKDKNNSAKNNKKQKADQKQDKPKQANKKSNEVNKITYSGTLNVAELAEKLNKEIKEIIKKLMFQGVMATKNQDLDEDTIELICSE